MALVRVSSSIFSRIKTIQKAVQRTTSHDEITVASGTYKETLTFEENRTVAAQKDATVCIKGAIVIADSATVTFENMTIQPTTQIYVEGQIILKNCVIQGGRTNVLLALNGGTIHCENTVFRDAPDAAVTLIYNSEAQFVHCHFENNKKVHILAENSTLHLTDCTLSKANQALWVKTRAKAYLTRVKVQHHSGTQLIIQDHALLEMNACEVMHGEGNGIYASDHSNIHLTKTAIQHHHLPQIWLQRSSLNITDCQIQYGNESGIILRDYSEAMIENSLIAFHKIANIQLLLESFLNMTNCEVNSCQGVGIHIKEKSIANFNGTVFAYNVLPQLFITENSICTIKDATIQEGKQIGVYTEKGASCSIVSSTITGHKNAALTVMEAELFLLNTTVHHNKGNGILAVNHAKASMDNCHFNHNDLAHIAGKNNSNVTIYQSELIGGKSIFVMDQCELEVTESVVKDGTGIQIEMVGNTNAKIQHSQISGGETNGIVAMKDTSVQIIGSQISCHKMPQIIINDSSLVLKDSELMEGERNGLIIENHAEALIQDTFISNHMYSQLWIDSESSVELNTTQIIEGHESDIFVQNKSILHASKCIIQNAKFDFNIQAVNYSKIYLSETMVDNSFGSKFYSENNSEISSNLDEIS
ncbi:right-handed parallel beta-helix repeat-containing protein [Solibacillus sp. FSL W7-1436]|uniref:right-handed parallel beta-helix repeat-containing protein n=1 Tax=Solibacillus sp. FSL W7-1436 TaxID=2921705 RepID=UPI0030F61A0C